MKKVEDFKKFVYNHPEFVDYVKNNKISWQSLYELYDIYGENDDIWKKYTKQTIKDTINISGLLDIIKKINLDSLEENISSIQKAVNLVEELTTPEVKQDIKNVKEEKINNIYGNNE